MTTQQQNHRIDFLYKAGHGMLFSLPSLSRYYMNEYQLTMEEYELKAPKSNYRYQCKSCGQIKLPGLNTRIELVKYKRKKNRLVSECLACCRTVYYHGSNKKKIPKSCITSELPVIDDIPSAIVVSTTTTTVQKKKKNKGKKNSLKAMLNKSSSAGTNSSSTSGGLGDFLSSL